MAPKRSRANGKTAIRNLILVLGDQLDAESAAFDGFDGQHDAVWMAEVAGEATRVWSHRARIALFLSAMRHFRGTQRAQGRRILYQELTAKGGEPETFAKALATTLREHRPKRLIVAEPGEWGVKQTLHELAQAHDVPLEVRTDRHFLCTKEDFAAHAEGRKQLRMEFFYREMRRRNAVLMDEDKPVGGTWNFDAENRASFGKSGPGNIAEPVAFPPDRTTRDVLKLVEERFAKHPGSLAHFDWPVTRDQALAALKDFVAHRLPQFGQYQDAMWASSNVGSDRRDAYLCHSRLSVALNLKLLNPREVIAAAEQAHREGHAPLPAVEGFIRQILGWREYVRGVYWRFMPDYLDRNALEADEPLPAFYWTGDTDMRCLRHALGQTLAFGYAHHIQRLMVTGLFALLLGVRPRAVHEWYLAVYLDAVEWVELPNTLGMSQFADGGVMASKPYVATGKYIQRMSNYCDGCRFNPAEATGDDACPFTTLYWDFLLRHETALELNQRMKLQLRNLSRLSPKKRRSIRQKAAAIRG